MIKEYFTDGLIGLAILLSLFRTDLDLVNINNLINYPEVQDIIQGQTAAYLPANFHHLANTPHAFGNPKHVDFDNEAFTAWFNSHISNNFRFRSQQHSIEAFLVSGPDPSVSNVDLHLQETSPSHNAIVEESSGSTLLVSSPTLPEEGANSYPELSISNTTAANGTAQEEASNSTSEQASVEPEPLLFNNPFPGCNLTAEDLELINVLWRQDEDLGVGREVFDANLRLELERRQEMEKIKIQEMKKTQLLAKEKEEHERKEQANKWLKENFRQDGETGEWVSLHTSSSGNHSALDSILPQPLYENEELPALDSDSLDYILNAESGALPRGNDIPQMNGTSGFQTSYMVQSTSGLQMEPPVQQQFIASQPQLSAAPAPVQHQDSVEEGWASLMNLFNFTSDTTEEGSGPSVNEGWINNNNASNEDCFFLEDASNSKQVGTGYVPPMSNPLPAFEPVIVDVEDVPRQEPTDFLLNNVSMPSDAMNTSADLVSVMLENDTATELNATSSLAPPAQLSPDLSSAVNFDLSDMGLFENITGLETSADEDLDMAQLDAMFRTIQSSGASLLEPMMELSQSMDTLQKLGEELNQSSTSNGSSSPLQDFGTLENLEGAVGGSDDFGFNETVDLTNLKALRRDRSARVQHLSESSNDSGFACKNGLSPSNSSTGSSYSGSPAGSSHGAEGSGTNLNHQTVTGSVVTSHNRSTSGNGTEHDPYGSHTVAQHQVAHNHTYNTPPGQVPREVKKYAQKEPSRKGPQSRDHRRAMELKIPFSVEEIIESPVETFNEMVSSYKLSEAQLSLIRDIRRRGKNKVAAQNCRKRKVSVIVNLSDARSDLEKARDELLAERAEMEAETRRMRAKFGYLYAHIFQSLRDEHGQPYDPSVYSLQQSTDGNVFLVPRNATSAVSAPTHASHMGRGFVSAGNGSTGPSSAASSASSSPSAASSASSSKRDMSVSKKRKTFDE